MSSAAAWFEAAGNSDQGESDIGGVPQIVCEKTVGASYGNAFLAACAVGLAQPEDIATWNPVRETVEPTDHEAHRRNHDLFKRLYLQTKDIAHAL